MTTKFILILLIFTIKYLYIRKLDVNKTTYLNTCYFNYILFKYYKKKKNLTLRLTSFFEKKKWLVSIMYLCIISKYVNIGTQSTCCSHVVT